MGTPTTPTHTAAALAPAPTLVCHFEPLDTWFFRESRPHGSVGSSELGSVFPPPVRTLLGSLRTLIGDAWHARHGTDWRQLEQLDALKAIIGHADDLGSLSVTGPFLSLHGQRLYPAPSNLMSKEENQIKHYFLLDLGSPVTCDLGTVYLPSISAQVPALSSLVGSKPVERCWLTQSGLQKILEGHAPDAQDVIGHEQLFKEEARLGIGRDNARKAVQEGLLYQTRHLRLHEGVSIELHLHGLPDATLLPQQGVIRLGGEGRQAALSVTAQNSTALPSVSVNAKASTLVLYSLTPTPCGQGEDKRYLPAGIPAGFKPAKHPSSGADVWEGVLGETPLRVLSVACTRPLREGGWDMANHQARPVQSLLTPGSVLYVQPLSDDQPLTASALAQLADATGRGLYAMGKLNSSSTFQP